MLRRDFASTGEGRPQPSSTTRDGAAVVVAEPRESTAYPELFRRGPHRLQGLRARRGGVGSTGRSHLSLTLSASPCSATGTCRAGVVLAVVEPVHAKHACCHFARVRPSPRHARRAGTAFAGRLARRVPSCAQLPAGSLSRCSPMQRRRSQVHRDRARIATKKSAEKNLAPLARRRT